MQMHSILTNELQLGQQLNIAIDQSKRSEFSLLLAMLSPDIREMAQFKLKEGLNTEQQLKAVFELPDPHPLVADVSQDPQVVNNSQFFEAEGAKSFLLRQCLTPEALVIRGNESAEMINVLDNTDIHAKNRHIEQSVDLPKPMPMSDQLALQRKISEMLA